MSQNDLVLSHSAMPLGLTDNAVGLENGNGALSTDTVVDQDPSSLIDIMDWLENVGSPPSPLTAGSLGIQGSSASSLPAISSTSTTTTTSTSLPTADSLQSPVNGFNGDPLFAAQADEPLDFFDLSLFKA